MNIAIIVLLSGVLAMLIYVSKILIKLRVSGGETIKVIDQNQLLEVLNNQREILTMLDKLDAKKSDTKPFDITPIAKLISEIPKFDYDQIYKVVSKSEFKIK